jgi:hypothetical protein
VPELKSPPKGNPMLGTLGMPMGIPKKVIDVPPMIPKNTRKLFVPHTNLILGGVGEPNHFFKTRKA